MTCGVRAAGTHGRTRDPAPKGTRSGLESETRDEARMTDKLRLSDDEWRKRLTAEEFRVLRQHGTEAPGIGFEEKSDLIHVLRTI